LANTLSQGPDVDDHSPEARLEKWRRDLRTESDEQLFASIKRELGNSGWGVLKSYYLFALREELERRGLADSDAVRAMDRRVIRIDPPA
jgi:hypothetical protein